MGQGSHIDTPSSGPATEEAPRSGYGAVPGGEFPTFVYISVLAAFGWVILASLLAFAHEVDADLALGMATVLGIVFFGLPIIIHHAAVTFSHPKPEHPREFLASPVDTATGPLSGASAWLQVLIIPLSLALAATLIGAASLLVR
ncbi:MAG TPA: hypothetical protein VFY92_00185 [Hyphomicrobiaceae bacterium]|nr:hypothetical protein [Hyphomicrobiaceae bacterium]